MSSLAQSLVSVLKLIVTDKPYRVLNDLLLKTPKNRTDMVQILMTVSQVEAMVTLPATP